MLTQIALGVIRKLALVMSILLVLSTFLFILLCHEYGVPVSGTGTIRYLSFEGGFYGIYSDDGKRYDPAGGLPEEFQVDGTRVEFTVLSLEYMMSSRMWGEIVRILDIRKLY